MRLRPFVIGLCLMGVAAAAGAQPAVGRQLIGRLVDEHGGTLPGAFVTVRPAQGARGLPELEVISDDAGRFRFDDVPPGTYRVAAHLFGFQLSQSVIEVAADRNTEASVVMIIGPAGNDCVGSFPITIRTRSGEPLPTAFLTATRAGRRPSSEAVLPTGERTGCSAPAIDDQITLDVLGYGEHILKRAGVDRKTVRWDVVIEPTAASRLGKPTRTSATGQIRGRVFDEFEASIADVSISFQPVDPRSGLQSFEVITDARGRFDFLRVRPGTYRVTAKAAGFETTVMIAEIVPGIETEVTIVLRRR